MAAVVAAFSACDEKKPDKDIITKKTVVKKPAAPVRMQNYDHSETAEWLGKEYSINIARHADTSLPIITDDTGNKYYDNKIDVEVKRPDGTVFYKKTFNKEDFAPHIGENYMKKSALLGIVVDHTAGDSLVLAASVGAPDVLSDDYVPLLITISRMGAISIEKDTRIE